MYLSWYLNQMVTQHMPRTSEGKQGKDKISNLDKTNALNRADYIFELPYKYHMKLGEIMVKR